MSFGAIRKRTHDAAQPQDTGPSGMCHADNCPCRGTISHGGDKFYCSAHAFADAAQWPRITSRLREFDWLIAFHDDVQRMDRACEDWRGFGGQFWHGQEAGDILAPHPDEAATPYQNRMRGELLFRCGLARRPAVRLPQSQVKGRRGNIGALAGAMA